MALKLPGRPIDRIRNALTQTGEGSTAAFAGGLGAAWLGGPLLGAAVGWLAHRANKNSLDRLAEDRAMIEQASEQVSVNNDSLRSLATSHEDFAMLNMFEAATKRANTYLTSRNPAANAQGQQLLEAISQKQMEFIDKQELQRIELGDRQFDQLNTILDDHRSESGDWLERRNAYSTFLASAKNPGDDLAFLISFMHVIEPGSTVQQGEFANAQNAAGVPDIAMTIYNRLMRDGGRLDDTQRAKFIDQARDIFNNNRELQIERNGRALQRARDAGIPESRLGPVALPIDINAPNVPTEGPRQSETPSSPAQALGNPIRDLVRAPTFGNPEARQEFIEGALLQVGEAQQAEERRARLLEIARQHEGTGIGEYFSELATASPETIELTIQDARAAIREARRAREQRIGRGSSERGTIFRPRATN